LILDDWGLEPLGPEQRHDMLEIVEDRYDRRGSRDFQLVRFGGLGAPRRRVLRTPTKRKTRVAGAQPIRSRSNASTPRFAGPAWPFEL
jgi:hypothetical protein